MHCLNYLYIVPSNNLLLLLAAMTYNQVRSFQINDYANHYVDIEITGYRVLYSKSIAGRGIARLISWLGTAGPIASALINQVPGCYIRVYRSFKIFTGRVRYSQLSVGPTLGHAPEMMLSTNIQDFRSLLQ